jgi:hypothetical protein
VNWDLVETREKLGEAWSLPSSTNFNSIINWSGEFL